MTNDQTVTQAGERCPHCGSGSIFWDARHRTAHSGEGREDVDYWNEVAQRLGHESVCEALEKLAELQGAGEGRSNGAGEDTIHRERKAVLQNKRVNDAIQSALERGELIVTPDGYLAALSAHQGEVERRAELLARFNDAVTRLPYVASALAEGKQFNVYEYEGDDDVDDDDREYQLCIGPINDRTWLMDIGTTAKAELIEAALKLVALDAARAQPEAGGE